MATASHLSRLTWARLVVVLGALACPSHAGAQPFPAASNGAPNDSTAGDGYSPITLRQRFDWSADGVFGRHAALAAVAGDLWTTGWNTPPEWGRTGRGAAFRLAEREVDVALSNGIEAGLGALWSEDPRYFRLGEGGAARRVGYAVRTVFVAPRRNGHMRAAWARYAGNTVNNVIEDAWLPPSQRTWQSTVIRSGNSIFGRLAANLWGEFGPDLVRAWSRHRSP